MENKRVCSHCGAPLESDDLFCTVCGAKQEAPAETTDPAGGNAGGFMPGGTGTSGEDSFFGKSLNMISAKVNNLVRQYFLGGNSRGLLIMLAGVAIIILAVVIGFPPLAIAGLVVILAGYISRFFTGNLGEKEVLSAIAAERLNLQKRAMEKLGVDESQVSMLDPIVITGYGVSPDASLEDNAGASSGLSFMKKATMKAIRGAYDPVVAYRISSDGRLLSLLTQTTCFYFTEDQLLIYSGNVDISTGKIYDESTLEISYKDISRIKTHQTLWKQFDKKKKKFVYKIEENLTLSACGEPFVFSVNRELTESAIDNQIAGMKALVREKKH